MSKTNPPTIADLTEIVTRFRAERDWAQFHTPKELAVSLVVESAELLELFQWKQGADLERQIEKKRDAIADELGDVLHSILLLAHDLKIDLTEATLAKLEKVAEKYPVERAKGKANKYDELGE